jgi:GlpG protein
MTEWIEVLRAPVEHDLGPFSRYLRAQGITTYIFERPDAQCLCVPANSNPVMLQELIERWDTGNVSIELYQYPIEDSFRVAAPTVFAQWHRFPLTLVLLVFSALTFTMISTPWGESMGGLQWMANMTLQPLLIEGENFRLLAELPSRDQWWRYWTPVFLHFNWMHIIFNSLMLLEMGRRIEMVQGSQRLLCLVMACALTSNLTQFYISPGSLFGGMSGVIYALAGYCWLYQRLNPAAGIDMPPGFMMMAFFWLLLCMSGLITLVGMGKIANAAHVGGLVSGLVLAGLLFVLDKHFPR